MKIIILTCIATILCFTGANHLKCYYCENPLDVQCEEKKLLKCPSPDDFCADMYYAEKGALWKQCIRKELFDVCKRKIDGVHCAACQEDGCNNLFTQDFKDAVKESKSQEILSAMLKKKQKENHELVKKVHVVKHVVTKQTVH